MRHARHHRAPYRSAYCVTSGWMNPLLDRSQLLPRVEKLVRRLGARPRRHPTFANRAAA